ncbi:MAG: precorrin-6A/cobalt-precorrin-6A reductase [Oscillospiraceae bacterium]|nr:precorrin-6A/cobalt-precorrin-6A reductase [Oscillospiraceae bacterium]
MYKICVFAGTTEGRELVSFLSGQPVDVTACVATEYGETLLSPADNVTVLAGRLDGEAMERLLRKRALISWRTPRTPTPTS